MKKVCIVLFVLLQALYVSAQNKNCSTALSNDDFQLKMNEVATKDNEPAKLEAAKKIVLNNCVLASQVKQLAVTFKSDLNRLDFAKAAYSNTFDKANFYEVYDAFGYFSNVFKLHDFIKGGQTQTTEIKTETKTETKPALKFPLWDYPDASVYKDINGCPSIISEKDFETFAKKISEMSQDAEKLKTTEIFFQKNCFSTTQIMKIISLIKPEPDRMILLKKGFFHCFDVKNYHKTLVCFNMADNKKVLQDFIKTSFLELTGNNQQTNTAPCEVFDKEFQEVKQVIKNQNFNNTRVTMCKQLIVDKKCLNAFQIKEIVKLFDFEDSRLDVAKYAYDYCSDKPNFVMKVSDALEFDSSKSDLLKYVQTKK